MKARIVAIYALSYALIFGVIFIPHWLDIRLWEIPEAYVDNPLMRWDVEWYLRIAQNGYRHVPQSPDPFENYVAFFPLYSVLIRIVGTVIGNLHLAGLLISQISAFVALVYLYRLQLLWSDEASARRILLILAFFPTAFYLLIAYSEAFFLCLILMSAYYTRTQKWWLSALLIGIASATRPNGILMIFVLFYEWGEAHQWDWSLLSRKWWIGMGLALLSASGLMAYMLYLLLEYGNAVAFLDSSRSAWGRIPTNPLNASILAIQNMHMNPYRPPYVEFVEVIILWLGFAISLVIGRRYHWGYALYCISSFYVVSFSRPEGMLRYYLVLFPVMMLIADSLKGYRFGVYLIVSILALILLSFWHTNWLFVG